MNIEKPEFKIGPIIRNYAKKKGVTQFALSKLLNCHQSNVYHIYNSENICTSLLWKISIALEYNFFKLVYGLDLDDILPTHEADKPTTIVISKEVITVENGSTKKTTYHKISEK